MSIEFPCPGCQQTLRVSEQNAGKNARCPECGTITPVPDQSAPATPQPQAWEFRDTSPSSPTEKPSESVAINPYAPPRPVDEYYTELEEGEVRNVVVSFGSIFDHAWNVWSGNLGLLLGITLCPIVITFVLNQVQQVILNGLARNGLRQGDEAAFVAVAATMGIVIQVLQVYFGIGQAQIALKLVRRRRAEFGDLFSGMDRLLPVLGASIIAGICLLLGLALLIVPGILLALAYWPFYFLIVDRKAGVFESFSKAGTITQGNWGTTFLMWLAGIGIVILGYLALCIGVLFAMPLVTQMYVTAYLMMSGQIPTRPGYGTDGRSLRVQPEPKFSNA